MKKYANIIVVVILSLFTLFIFSACNTAYDLEETRNTTTEDITDMLHNVADEHSHTWSKWEIVKGATCLETGEKERVCDCGERETQRISAVGHKYVDGVCSACKLLKDSEGLEYTLNHDGVSYTVTGIGTCDDFEHLIIPSTYKGLPVTGIGDRAFEYKILEKVTLSEGIKTVGDSAFSQCTDLEQIYLPEGLVSIGNTAFLNCRELRRVLIPNSVTNMGAGVFMDCTSLSDITLSGSMTQLSRSMFAYCQALKSITIPQGITLIEEHAFAYCHYLKSVTVPSSLKKIEEDAFEDTPIVNVYLSDLSAWCGIEIVGHYASPIKPGATSYLNGQKMTSLRIPDGVTAIGKNAFMDATTLTDVVISADVTSIGECAFYGCTGLTGIVIPDNVEHIGQAAFCSCTNLKDVTLSSGLTEIPAHTFSRSGVLSIKIGNSITSIGKGAFQDCTALQRIEIGDGLKTAGEYAFAGCTGLKGVYITDLANWCEISFDTVGPLYYAQNLYLNGALITDLQIPEGVKTIQSAAFWGCKSLVSVSFPKSLEYIASYAFQDCTGLTAVYITDMAAWCNVAISGSSNPLIYAGNLYFNGDLVNELYIPTGITKINQCAFTGCTSLLKVVIPDSVTSIGGYAFKNCKNLTELNIGGGVIDSAEAVFENCTSLESVILNEGGTFIPMSWFNGCTALKSIVIPSSVKEIASYAFYGCTNLTSVVFVNTTGWKYMSSSATTGGTDIAPEALSDSTEAAALLKKYATYKWFCN